jgi:hypothetical protein
MLIEAIIVGQNKKIHSQSIKASYWYSEHNEEANEREFKLHNNILITLT